MRKELLTYEPAMASVRKWRVLPLLGLTVAFSVAFKIYADRPDNGRVQIQPIDAALSSALQPSNRTDPVVQAFKKIDGTAQKKKKRKHVSTSKNIHKSKSGKHKRSVTQATSTPGAQTNKPDQSEMKRAGEFKGDLRDLPQTPPVVRERPKREDPKITRKVIKKPGVQKDN